MVSRENRVLLASTGAVLVVLVTLLLLWGQWNTVEGRAQTIVGGASVALLVGLVAYEFWAGYRSTAA